MNYINYYFLLPLLKIYIHHSFLERFKTRLLANNFNFSELLSIFVRGSHFCCGNIFFHSVRIVLCNFSFFNLIVQVFNCRDKIGICVISVLAYIRPAISSSAETRIPIVFFKTNHTIIEETKTNAPTAIIPSISIPKSLKPPP